MNALFGANSGLGLIVVGGAVVWIMSTQSDRKAIPDDAGSGSKTDTGGMWQTELPFLYGEDEPRGPLGNSGGPLADPAEAQMRHIGGRNDDTAVGLEERLHAARQQFLREQFERGMSKHMADIPLRYGDNNDESSWIIEPSFAKGPRHPEEKSTPVMRT